MSILDTFWILFKSDTSDLEKGHKKAEKSTKDLKDKVKDTNSDIQDLGASFLDLATKAAAAFGIVIGVGAAINSVFGTEKQALNIGFFAENTGLAVGKVDALAQATTRYGGTLEGVLNTLDAVQQGLTFQSPYAPAGDKSYAPTPLAIQAAQFGIALAPGVSVENFYDQLHNKFKNQPAALNEKQGKILGLDLATIRMLQDTDEMYGKIKKDVGDIGVLTDANTQAARQFYMTWGDINQIVREFELILGTKILDFFNNLPALIEKNKVQFEALTEAARIFGIVALLALSPIIVSMLVLAAPLIIAIALFGALYLAIYNIKSGFASFFKDINAWGQYIVNIFKDLYGWVSKIITAVESFNPFGKKGASKEGLSQKDAFDQEEKLYRAQMTLRGASASPITTRPGGLSGNNTSATSVHVGSITVHTQATDADGIASAIGNGLTKHINNTINNYSTDVRA